MLDKIKNMIISIYEFTEYVVKFFVLLVICYCISIVLPMTCFQVSVLMMAFWFLNLYNTGK